MLHSSMSSRNQWRTLMESVRARHRVITIDLLGYGESPLRRRTDDYRLADEARHVESILAKLLAPGESFHVVGHSYGAAVGLSLAQRMPERISSLTLFEPMAVHLLPPGDPARQEFERLAAEVRRCAAEGDAAGGAARFIDYWSGNGSFADLPAVKQQAFTALLPKVLLEFDGIAIERRVTGWLRDLRAPVCLMYGRSSPMPPRRIVANLATLIPHAHCVEVVAGHMAPVTHPELVNPLIQQFLSNAESRKRARPARSARAVTNYWAGAFVLGVAGLVCTAPATRSADLERHGANYEVAVTPVNPDSWRDLPARLTHGGRYAVISGDPGVAGSFVLQVELEPGFELPPCSADRELQLVVLKGELTVGSGHIAHPAATRHLTAGYFAVFGAHKTHFARTERGATVQLFGVGPVA
jgi:pimeloyl-ACP methyl ester carboxylesterase